MLTVLELPTLQWGVRWVQIEKLHEPPVTGSESMQSKIMLKFSASRKKLKKWLPHPERGRYHDIDFSIPRRGPLASADCLKTTNVPVGSSLGAYRGASLASRDT